MRVSAWCSVKSLHTESLVRPRHLSQGLRYGNPMHASTCHSRKCRATTPSRREIASTPRRLHVYFAFQRSSVSHIHHAMMSAFQSLSPLLRRSGAFPTWTCRACSQSQGRAIAPSNAFTNRIEGQRTFATRVEAAKKASRQDPTIAGSRAGPNANNGRKNKRRRRLVIAGGAVTIIGAAGLTISDDAKHAYTAGKRSYRVAETLALNIKEYIRIQSCTGADS